MPADAPIARAFAMCPMLAMPPSAITGTPSRREYLAHLYTAVACARPTAMVVCVVQIDPGPIPMRSASAPA